MSDKCWATGKVRFESRHSVFREARVRGRRRGGLRANVLAYRCDSCGGWHATNANRDRRLKQGLSPKGTLR